ncbi:MAG: M20/M25/M40 family metallo-hydrolase [Nitrospirota bacterium]|nr:M20/M25/M40 family metallo-hydrolase [Nitrospirota bacterium]
MPDGIPCQLALQVLDTQREAIRAQLADLVRTPGVSADGFPRRMVEQSSREVAAVLRNAGLENVRAVAFQSAPPFILGDWLHAPAEAPTILIYGHYDVQPAGDESRWDSPPWQPEERDGRLYGRGVADDKAGIMAHVAAAAAWLEAGGLPVNIKFILEGEEEIGSPNLEAFLSTHRDELAADCLILTDTCNLDTGLPSLTTSLRGLIMADVTVASLQGPLHSGIWGGPIPDPAQALARILARLSDDAGRCAIPGIARPPVAESTYTDLPYDEARFREQGGVLEGVPLLTRGGAATYASTWRDPVATVSAIDAPSLATASNQVLAQVSARVGVRLAPEQSADACLKALVDFLAADPPWGCRVTVTPHVAAGGWQTTPSGPYFDAARRALVAGYGAAATHIGCGGSIPFVEPFARAMGGIPALLLGVEDPLCRAHGENESLDLSDFFNSCRATVHLYAEMAAIQPPV